jgi:hypothetical protein
MCGMLMSLTMRQGLCARTFTKPFQSGGGLTHVRNKVLSGCYWVIPMHPFHRQRQEFARMKGSSPSKPWSIGNGLISFHGINK